MKKWLLIISATVICVAAAFLYFFSLTPKGDTITSRESILNTAISKGNEWTIAKELELGGYIVSGAYSTDNKSTLAIFEPTGNGDYKFSIDPLVDLLRGNAGANMFSHIIKDCHIDVSALSDSFNLFFCFEHGPDRAFSRRFGGTAPAFLPMKDDSLCIFYRCRTSRDHFFRFLA